MTQDLITREFAADIEVRSFGDGRTIHGIVVPFDQPAMVSDGGRPYREAFQSGAFRQAIGHMGGNYGKVKLLSQHQSGRNPLGRANLLREDGQGLYGEFQVSKTTAGDEALELVKDGALDSFSVGFIPVQHAKRGDVTWRTEAGIREASLVTFPSYPGANIGGVREQWDGLTDEQRTEALEWLRAQHLKLPDLGQVGTSDEGAPADEAAAMQLLRSASVRQRLAFRRELIERGIRNES